MSARVDEVAALQAMKIALVKFAELARHCMSEAHGDVKRTQQWLELEQGPYWVSQIRKRSELVRRCQEAVRQKQLFTDSTGGRSSAVDELKALAKAQASLKEAEEKLAATKAHLRKFQKVEMEFSGGIQKLATVVQLDIAAGVARLNSMSAILNDYAAAPEERKSLASAPPPPTIDPPPTQPDLATPEATDGPV